jgi:hypothetical protein
MSTYEHVCGACGRPDTPRVWRSGDDEPGEDVRAVMDAVSVLWSRTENGTWSWVDGHDGGYAHQVAAWEDIIGYGPLVEVMLPEPVLS